MAQNSVKVCPLIITLLHIITIIFHTTADINECALGVCSNRSNSVCEDTPGSYICMCEQGYQENDDGDCEGELCCTV